MILVKDGVTTHGVISRTEQMAGPNYFYHLAIIIKQIVILLYIKEM